MEGDSSLKGKRCICRQLERVRFITRCAFWFGILIPSEFMYRPGLTLLRADVLSYCGSR